MRIAAHGLAAELPAGWEGVIARPAEPQHRMSSGVTNLGVTRPTLHLSTRPLPPQRGDFGSGVVETLATDDAFVALVEFGPECVGTALFAARGIPRDIAPGQLQPSMLQRTIAGQAGFQHFCTEAGRAFSLYVVVGSHGHAGRVLPEVRLVLRGLSVAVL